MGLLGRGKKFAQDAYTAEDDFGKYLPGWVKKQD